MADNTNVKFLTVSEFKDQVGASELRVLNNKKTGKLFMSCGAQNYKVQQDIDKSKDIRVLIPDNDMNEACLVNTNGGATEMFTL